MGGGLKNGRQLIRVSNAKYQGGNKIDKEK